MSKRDECLNKALEYVTSDRAATYGTPEDNFGKIAAVWNALGVRIYNDSHGSFADRDEYRAPNATDVALMMAGLKLARLSGNHDHDDSWIDVAGYAACGMETSHADERTYESPDVRTLLTGEGQVFIAPVGTPIDVSKWKPLGFTTETKRGWVSDINRCAPDEEMLRDNEFPVGMIGSKMHAAHRFGLNGAQWCDGYV